MGGVCGRLGSGGAGAEAAAATPAAADRGETNLFGEQEDLFERGSGDDGAGASGVSGPLVRPTAGALVATARIHRGSIGAVYTFDNANASASLGGVVRAGVHRETGRRFVIKTISKLNAPPERLNIAKNETQIALRLDHPHIVRLYEIWESFSRVDIVSEFCAGGNLSQLLACSKFGLGEHAAVPYLRAMFAAVAYLHANRIVHRDLRVDSWFIQRGAEAELPGTLKLGLALGLAQVWTGKKCNLHTTCGTLVYCAPETLLGKYNEQCDVWSLGCIAYILLVGYPPFFGSEEEVVTRILKGRFDFAGPRWAAISPAAKDLIRRCLEQDPSRRLTAAAAGSHPFLAAAEPSAGVPLMLPALVRLAVNTASSQRLVLRLAAQRLPLVAPGTALTAVDAAFLELSEGRGVIDQETFERIAGDSEHHQMLDRIFADALSQRKKDVIQYTDFLAAALKAGVLPFSEDVLLETFILLAGYAPDGSLLRAVSAQRFAAAASELVSPASAAAHFAALVAPGGDAATVEQVARALSSGRRRSPRPRRPPAFSHGGAARSAFFGAAIASKA